MIKLSWNDVDVRLKQLCESVTPDDKVWGIPRGGAIVAGLARLYMDGIAVADNPEHATIAIDDIIDSGETANRIKKNYGLETVALVNKQKENITDWVHFPWEEKAEQDIEQSVQRIIEYLGDNPARSGLKNTPHRVVKSWKTLFQGYEEQAESSLVWFEDDTDEMIISKDIQFYSTCEHHMLPFFGTVSIGYIPTGKVLGISKLSRVVNTLARKLQIQEKLTREIGQLLEQHVKGVAVHVEGQHLCMMARGVSQQQSIMITNYLTGSFRHLPECRAEFFTAIK